MRGRTRRDPPLTVDVDYNREEKGQEVGVPPDLRSDGPFSGVTYPPTDTEDPTCLGTCRPTLYTKPRTGSEPFCSVAYFLPTCTYTESRESHRRPRYSLGLVEAKGSGVDRRTRPKGHLRSFGSWSPNGGKDHRTPVHKPPPWSRKKQMVWTVLNPDPTGLNCFVYVFFVVFVLRGQIKLETYMLSIKIRTGFITYPCINIILINCK